MYNKKEEILSVYNKKTERQRYLRSTLDIPCSIFDIRSFSHSYAEGAFRHVSLVSPPDMAQAWLF
jgi:hypothetical protein